MITTESTDLRKLTDSQLSELKATFREKIGAGDFSDPILITYQAVCAEEYRRGRTINQLKGDNQ